MRLATLLVLGVVAPTLALAPIDMRLPAPSLHARRGHPTVPSPSPSAALSWRSISLAVEGRQILENVLAKFLKSQLGTRFTIHNHCGADF